LFIFAAFFSALSLNVSMPFRARRAVWCARRA
jgi:hypothetical protein